MSSELRDKQKLFVAEYLIDRNATQAAIRAGYSENSAKQIGWELTRKPEVIRAVEEACRARENRTLINQDYVLTVAHEMVERCRQGEPVMEFDHSLKEMVPTGEWQFDSGGVAKGLEIINKLQGYGQKSSVDVNLSGKVETEVSGALKVDIQDRIEQLKKVGGE